MTYAIRDTEFHANWTTTTDLNGYMGAIRTARYLLTSMKPEAIPTFRVYEIDGKEKLVTEYSLQEFLKHHNAPLSRLE